MKNKTAILIFANSGQKDAERKNFFSEDLFTALNKQTLAIVKKTGLPFFLFSEKEQNGTTFGDRFSNAIEAVFNKGFKSVITIGNDTPHLKSKHLKETSQKLNSNDLVLGPSKDGGFYLMGIKKAHFNKKTFLNLPWQTSKLQKCITSILKVKKLKINFLEVLHDIDAKEDIKVILESFRTIPTLLLKLLKTFTSSSKTFFEIPIFNVKKTFYTPNSNKGSPLIFCEL